MVAGCAPITSGQCDESAAPGTLEIQEGDVQLVAGRVTVQNGIQVIADGTPDTAVILQRFQNHLPEHHCRGCWTVEQIRQMKTQRTLELLVIEDGRVEKARQNGLCRSSLAGFVTNALPNGVTVLHLFDAVALSGCHRVLLRRPEGFNGREAKGSPVTPASLVGEFPTESPQRLASLLVFPLKQGHRRGGTDGIDTAFQSNQVGCQPKLLCEQVPVRAHLQRPP